MRPVQYFSKNYLDECRKMKPEQVLRFLEKFRLVYSRAKSQRGRRISIKMPEDLLEAFKAKSRLHGVPYQTQIKRLMKKWLG